MTPTDDQPPPGQHEPGQHGPGEPRPAEDDDRPVTTEELIAWRDGDLDEARTEQIRARLSSDPDAAARLDEIDQTDAILERLRTTPPPADLSRRVQQAIDDEIAGGEGRDQPRGETRDNADHDNADHDDGDRDDGTTRT